MNIEKYKQCAPGILRLSMALVFLWFGLNQVFNPSFWVGYLPSWTYNLVVSANTLVMLNGFFETILSVFLLVGSYTRISALLLGLHLLGITFSIGYNDIAIRDFGLAIATFVVFLNGPDRWTMDYKRNR